MGFIDGKVLVSDENIKLRCLLVKCLAKYWEIQGVDVKVEVLFLGDSLGSTDGKILGYDEGIKLGFTEGKVIGTLLENVDWFEFGLDVGSELGSLYWSLDGYNDGKL